MTPETSTPSRLPRLLGWRLLAVLLAFLAWAGWREHDERAAVREAEAAGWLWETREPFTLILADWHLALDKATWNDRYRHLALPDGTDLAAARPLLARLHPTLLIGDAFPNSNLSALQGLSALQEIHLSRCYALQNVDGLQGCDALLWLRLIDCPALQNVDGLHGCGALRKLILTGCTGLKNVDALKGLSALETLNLYGCDAIPSAALRELRAALPKTDIEFPDGSKAPPP